MKPTLCLLCILFFLHNLSAQQEVIGFIEIYGRRSQDTAVIRNSLGIKEGSLINRQTFNKTTIENRIRSLPGISDADVSLLCCDDVSGQSILYIGIDDDTSVAITRKPVPTGSIKLEKVIIGTYDRYNQELINAVKAGQTSENNEQGHVILEYAPIKPFQDTLISYSIKFLPLIKQVLCEASHAEHRRAASWIIAYASD